MSYFLNEYFEMDDDEIVDYIEHLQATVAALRRQVRRQAETKKYRKTPKGGLRFQVFKRDGYQCQMCGAKAPGVELHLDHKVSAEMGGETTLENLWVLCSLCNKSKRTASL